MTQMPVGMPGMEPGGGIGEHRATGLGDSVRVTVSSRGGVGDASAVDASIEADITTGDALGVQFEAAFNLPAPAMQEGLGGRYEI